MALDGYAQLLKQQCQLTGLPVPEAEFRFAPPRRWRFDLVFHPQRLAVEIEGAIWQGGRHTRGAGFEKDAEKYAEALIRGWRVLRVSTGMVRDGRALGFLERALAASTGQEQAI